MIAGRRAMEAAAYADALRHFELASKHQTMPESAANASLLYELGMAKQSLGRWEEALADWQHSLDLFVGSGDPTAAGGVAAAAVETLAWTGRYIDAAQIAYRGLACLEGSRSADRARLLAELGMINSTMGAFEPARDLLTEALELADGTGDGKTQGIVLSFTALNRYAFLRMEDAIACGYRGAELLRESGAAWSLAQLLGFLQIAMLNIGRISEARTVGEELDPLATKIGHSAALMLCNRARAWGEFSIRNDLVELFEHLHRDLQIVTSANLPWTAGSYAQLAVLEFYRGNWDLALDHAQRGYAAEFPTAFEGYATGALIRQLAYSGDRHGALTILDQKHGSLPRLSAANTIGSSALLVLSIEALFVIGERAQAWDLYPLTAQLVETGVKAIAEISRFSSTAAALAATAGCRWDLAENHFLVALRQAEEFPHQLEQIEIKRFYGQMLLERSGKGDKIKARSLLESAHKSYERVKMLRHQEITESLLAKTH
jgi:tetratricopeptide (TPR) repeat protein